MFYDEIKSATTKPLFTSFMEQHEEYTTKSEFSVVEKKILHYILPADILIKYLFIDADPFLITDNIITNVYEKENIENFLKAFSKGKWDFKWFINYLTDYRNFKKNFFKGVQKYLVHIFREEVKGKEDMDDLMSEIWENIENSESFKVPERIKKESKIMEKILNFYITLIGWLRISRGDDFSLRLYNKKMINEILDQTNFLEDKKDSIYYYWSLLYSYWKNVFYYRYASENIRSGKQKFYLPYQSDSKKIYSNMYIVKLFDENFLCTILQDFNVKDVKIYVKNQKILDIFKKLFGKEISLYVKENTDELIEKVYGELWKSLEEIKNFTKIIKKNIDEQDIYHLKDNMYSLDFWLAQSLYSQIQKSSIIQQYSDQTLLGILANCRDTLLWFLVYIKYIEQKNTDWKIKTELLWKIYCNDILNVRDPAQEEIKEIGKLMLKEFDEILTHWIEIDDNKAFFQIGLDNWIEISKHLVDNKHYLSWDDIIRFKWYLKNITYYNKRFLIPK